MSNKFSSKLTMNTQSVQQAQQKIVNVSKMLKTISKKKPTQYSRSALDPTRRTTYK